MRRVCQQRGSKYSRERGAGRERRTGGYSSFEIKHTHTHTHTQKGEAGRGDAEERPKYDKERRGRGGIEPHLERQTTASPKSQGSRDEREREAACAPLGEQALSLAACFCFITGLVVEYGISDRLYPKSRP